MFAWEWVPEECRERGLLLYNLNSGSSGNCTLVSDGRTHVLIDLGLSKRQLKKRLGPVGLDIDDLHGLVLTHLHGDHVNQTVADIPCPVFIQAGQFDVLPHPNVTPPLAVRHDRWRRADGPVTVGTLTLDPFHVSHDGPGGTVGYLIRRSGGHGPTLFYCTDTGQVTDPIHDALHACDFAALETNHNPRLLLNTRRPDWLIRRILSPIGHLNNGQAAHALRRRLAVDKPLLGVMALHLSGDANTPAIVDRMFRALLRGTEVPHWIASRRAPTPPLWITPEGVHQEAISLRLSS